MQSHWQSRRNTGLAWLLSARFVVVRIELSKSGFCFWVRSCSCVGSALGQFACSRSQRRDRFTQVCLVTWRWLTNATRRRSKPRMDADIPGRAEVESMVTRYAR